jgi:DNA-binding transcriptional MerR regulator
MTEVGVFRIGELSRRSGVSPELLRAWERRYDLLRPTRSPGGLRLYSARDLERVQAMQRHLARGLAAAEAAALATQPEPDAAEGAPHDRARGWRIVYLGADTPLASVADAARACDPEFVVVSAVGRRVFGRHRSELQQLAAEHRLCLGGAGAAAADVENVEVLAAGPVEEAERLTQLARSAVP